MPTKNVICPKCGEVITIATGSLGRKRLDIPSKTIYDTLRTSTSIVDAARTLHCSRAYIYKVLKEQGKTVEEVMKGK